MKIVNKNVDKLIEEARLLGHHQTAESAVTAALQEYVQHHKHIKNEEILDITDYDLDYKKYHQLARQ
jgi:Bacterial antitoxin of type II TA system, VapB